jgi:hypothetical protein
MVLLTKQKIEIFTFNNWWDPTSISSIYININIYINSIYIYIYYIYIYHQWVRNDSNDVARISPAEILVGI